MEVRNFDFSKGFTLAGVIELSGSFGTNPENSMVEIKLGWRGNHPPDCSNAYPSIAEIWPPNHDLWPMSSGCGSDRTTNYHHENFQDSRLTTRETAAVPDAKSEIDILGS
jgi:hypothetical protein